MWNLSVQLENKLQPVIAMPQAAQEAWERCRTGMGDVSKDLGVSSEETKRILQSVAAGGARPDALIDSEFLQNVSRAGRWYRWLACSTLRDVFGDFRAETPRTFPAAGTYFT